MNRPITFHVISLFPSLVQNYIGESIIGRAIKDKKIRVRFYNPRDFAMSLNKKAITFEERRIDNKPYGGGPGMVIEAFPVVRAIESALKKVTKGTPRDCVKIFFFSPSGKKFDTSIAKKTAKKYRDIILICGRYEGIDARVKKIFKCEDISIGDFVLTGGEIPAMVLIDSISRQIPKVLGDLNSLEENRVASPEVYTRPEMIIYKKKKYKVPSVLLSGNHKKIEEWRKQKTG